MDELAMALVMFSFSLPMLNGFPERSFFIFDSFDEKLDDEVDVRVAGRCGKTGGAGGVALLGTRARLGEDCACSLSDSGGSVSRKTFWRAATGRWVLGSSWYRLAIRSRPAVPLYASAH